MKRAVVWLIGIWSLPLVVHADNFFHLERVPQGTKIDLIKLTDIIPFAAATPLRQAELTDVFVQANNPSAGIPANVELLGNMKCNTSLPGLATQGAVDLVMVAKLFFGSAATAVEGKSRTTISKEQEVRAPKPSNLPIPRAPVKEESATPVVFPAKEGFNKGVERPAATFTPPTSKLSAAQEARAKELEDIFARKLNPTIKVITKAILPALPNGRYTENAQGLLVEQNPAANNPPKVLLKTDNVYVVLDPDIALKFSKAQVQDFKNKLEQMPEWPGMAHQIEMTAPALIPSSSIKQLEVSMPPSQMTSMIRYGSNFANPEVYQSENNVYVRTDGNNYMVLSSDIWSKPNPQDPQSQPFNPRDAKSVADLVQLVKNQKMQYSAQQQMLSKAAPLAPTAAQSTQPTLEEPELVTQKLPSYLPEPLDKALIHPQTKLPAGQTYTTIAPGIKRSTSTGNIYVAIKGTNQFMEFNEGIWQSRIPTPTIVDYVQKAYQTSMAPVPEPEEQKPVQKSLAQPSMEEQPAVENAENYFVQEVKPGTALKRGESFAGHTLVSFVAPTDTVEPLADQYVYVQSSSGKDYLFNKQVIKTGITDEQLKQFVDTQEASSHPFIFGQRPLTRQEVETAKDQIDQSLSKLVQLPKTNYSTALINELNAELTRLNLPATPPTAAELPAITKAQQYLERIGTPPPSAPSAPKKPVTQAAEEQYATIRAKFIKQIDSLNKLVTQKLKDISSIGGALFVVSLQNPDYKPFEKAQFPGLPAVDLPVVKDIELKETELGIYFAPPKMFSIWAQGTGQVINIPLLAKVFFNYEPDNTGIVLQAGLPETWKFSDSFANMQAFDRLEIKRAYVYVSTIRYVDYTIPTHLFPTTSTATVAGKPAIGMLPGIRINPGLSLYGEINLRKLVPEVFDHLSFVGLETASMYGTISYKPENCQIGIGLPDLIKIKDSPFKLGGVWLEIHAKEMSSVPGVPGPFKPEVSFVIALVIQPSPNDDTLTFTARATTDEAGGLVAFSMEGFWNNALGVAGLSIGDLALQLHTDYKQLLAGVPVSGGGFIGTVKFGTQSESPIIKLGALYAASSQGQEMAMEGKLDGTISIWQIIDGCKSLALNQAKQQKKPARAIENSYNQILNNGATKQLANIAVRNAEFKIAPTTVYIGEFPIPQGFTAKGEFTLLGVTAVLDFNVSQSGFTATGSLSPIKIGDIFSLTGAGKDKKYGTEDDAATMSLALNFSEQHMIITAQVKLLGITQQTDMFLDADGLNCTIAGKLYNLFDASVILKTQGDIEHPDLYFKASMKQEFKKFIIDQISKAIQDSSKDSIAKIIAAQKDVDTLNSNIADLERQINDHQNRIKQLSPNIGESIKNSPEITKLGLEIAGLETAHAGAIASRETAKGVLEGAKHWIQGGNIIAQRLIDFGNVITVDLRDVTIEASIQELAKGHLPRYTSTAIVFGKTINLDMHLDFSSPATAQQSAQAIGQQILKTLQKIL